jgi:hypothetical protein
MLRSMADFNNLAALNPKVRHTAGCNPLLAQGASSVLSKLANPNGT